MLVKEIEVYSEKYDIHGVIRDYKMVTKLFFTYKGKDIEMGIDRNTELLGKKYEDFGREIIESYIENLACQEERKLQLHYWYIDEHEEDGKTMQIGHGVVTGHKRLPDSNFIHTSPIQAMHLDEESGELILTTKNSVYHCPLEYCRYRKQDRFPDIIPDYDDLKRKYKDKISYPEIEKGKVLLVLADFCEYYFHSLCYVPENSESGKRLDYVGSSHIGTFQDSYLITTEDWEIDLRYFPHYQNIEFYGMDTQDHPLYLENIGGRVLYAQTCAGTIKLEPGDRKEVKEENAESEDTVLPDGDLYPAGVIG